MSDRGTPIDRAPARVFIQWKGTNACFDFDCPNCGYNGHFDGFFAYVLACKECGAVYEMPSVLEPRRIEPSANAMPVVPDNEGDLTASD